MLYIQHYIKTVHFWLKYNGFDNVRKTTKLIERGHRGFRTIGILLRFFTFFLRFLKIQKVVTFYVFCRASYVFSNYDEDLFLPSQRCLMPPSWGTTCDINAIYTSLKSTFIGQLQFRRWQYGYIFIRLAAIASETREMSRNSKRIRDYSSSRSSKIIDLGVNRKPWYRFRHIHA